MAAVVYAHDAFEYYKYNTHIIIAYHSDNKE